MNLEQKIANVESKWLSVLIEEHQAAFAGTHLQSHDIYHVLRSWGFAKDLYKELVKKDKVRVTEQNLERVLIDLFFHDMGMSTEIGSSHGLEGRRLAEKFFEKQDIPQISQKLQSKILDDIEKHDDKQYKGKVYTGKSLRSNPFSVFCVSDDLDAFGANGAYRYLEINYLRRIKKNKEEHQNLFGRKEESSYLLGGLYPENKNPLLRICQDIISNIHNRWYNLEQIYGDLEEFAKKHHERFRITFHLIQDMYNETVSLNEDYSYKHSLGALGVYHYLIDNCTNGNVTIFKINELVQEDIKMKYPSASNLPSNEIKRRQDLLKFFEQFNKELQELHSYEHIILFDKQNKA